MNTDFSPELVQRLRQGFKQLNRFMVMVYRLGLGGWLNSSPEFGGRIMVISHTGRKSGAQRLTPVNYNIVDGEIYCLAGFGQISDWYRNLIKNPKVEVWLPDGWWCGVAKDISDSPARLSLLRQVIIGSGYAARVFGIDVYAMTDAELDALSGDYRLIHIKRTEARTGAGGPGDLAWVWPAATFVLLALFLFRRKK